MSARINDKNSIPMATHSSNEYRFYESVYSVLYLPFYSTHIQVTRRVSNLQAGLSYMPALSTL